MVRSLCGDTVQSDQQLSDEQVAAALKSRGVLLVDDEESLRQPVCKMLKRRGFSVFDAADGACDPVLAFGAGAATDLLGQLGQCRLGGLQQTLALARPLLGQERVFAHDEPLAGKLGRGDLGQIALVEQRELEGAGIEKGADLRGSESGDPVEPGRCQLVADGRW